MPDDNNDTRNQEPQTKGVESLKTHVLANKVDVGMWATRILTILFALAYMVPIFGNAQNAYYKVFMANAATSALRLHQRLPRVVLTKEFLSLLLIEDSCHYLFFTLIFLLVSPVSFIIMPVVLFAVLHSASYSLTLLDQLGQNSWWGARLMISLVELQTRNILRLAALSEILLMPLTIVLVFMGRAGVMTPFIYYQFLMLRYSSRRNPHTRHMFHEIRMTIEATAAHPSVPGIARKILMGGISIVSRLAPPMPQ